jgi:hypothetical protein
MVQIVADESHIQLGIGEIAWQREHEVRRSGLLEWRYVVGRRTGGRTEGPAADL